MKRLIGCVLVFLLGVGATLAYLAWRDRAAARDEAVLDVGAAAKLRKEIGARVDRARQRDGSARIVLTEADIEALITSALAENPRGDDLVRIVRDVRADIGQDLLEVGIAVDVAALERSGLADEKLLERVLGILPMLRDRELYIGFRGVPGVRDGKIALVDGLEVTLGFLTLPVADLEKRFGLSVERLYSKLVFDVEWFVVKEVRARNGELAVEVRAR